MHSEVDVTTASMNGLSKCDFFSAQTQPLMNIQQDNN
jgi:hypothetical protein